MVEAGLAKGLIEAAPKGVAVTGNDVWGLILGDRIAYYRRKNAMKLSKLLHEEAEKLGGRVDPTRVPDQFAYEWGEAATRKSDETLQVMFARLLANASTENGSRDERLIYSLREMSGEDAVFFNELYELWSEEELSGPWNADVIFHLKELKKISIEVSLDNLLRLGLIRESHVLSNDHANGGIFTAISSNSLNLSLSMRRQIGQSALGMLLYSQVNGNIADDIAD